jgi:hypothetical protein
LAAVVTAAVGAAGAAGIFIVVSLAVVSVGVCATAIAGSTTKPAATASILSFILSSFE